MLSKLLEIVFFGGIQTKQPEINLKRKTFFIEAGKPLD